ncbi:MAG TPA: LptF/LptG family permease, partial [Phycisphaerae bacterium]|nr:LptF/LptG family permease [Phycisphaerae bacterium]
MLKTLHGYIAKDLVKITLLATFTFTLLMTVFAILEPLRKRGLASGQVFMLFGYTLPVMLALTLPFAALFATTIVYGRFAQDRELLACRASGIATGTTLRPAIALGVVVTIISMILTNFVSPEMARRGERNLVANLKQIAYHKLKKEGILSLGDRYIIHVSRVREEDKADNIPAGLEGVIAGQRVKEMDPKTGKEFNSLKLVVASQAYLETTPDEETGKHYASVQLNDQVGPVSYNFAGISSVDELPLTNIPIESPTKEKASFYSWPKLLATRKDPTLNSEIGKDMRTFKRKIIQNRVMQTISKTINAGEPYAGLFSRPVVDDQTGKKYVEQYIVSAGRAVVNGDTAKLESVTTKDGRIIPVVVRRIKGEMVKTTPDGKESFREAGPTTLIVANAGSIIARYEQTFDKTSVTISLSGNVMRKDSENPDAEMPVSASQKIGQILMPRDSELDSKPISEFFQDWKAGRITRYTDDPEIIKQMQERLKKAPRKVQGEIKAEMNTRIAFGLSAVLLVAMGAALGLMFKGGQMLSAFALSVIPAAIILVLIMMGKKMISNPGSSDTVGLIAIWGGNAGMLLADVLVYLRIS